MYIDITSTFNLRSLIGHWTNSFSIFRVETNASFSAWIMHVQIRMFGFISRAFERERLPRQKNTLPWTKIYGFNGMNLFFLVFSLFQNSLRIPNTLERCHDLRAITSHRLIAFCILQLVHHVGHNWYSNNSDNR